MAGVAVTADDGSIPPPLTDAVRLDVHNALLVKAGWRKAEGITRLDA